jgi:hypothetical protein
MFVLNRFGGIEVKEQGEAGEVRFFQENKQGDVFTSRVRTIRGYTPTGVQFLVTKLDKPVIHDKNRRINSGEWKLQIIGTGPAFNAMRARVPVLADFAASGEEMTFYGDKTDG